MRKAANKKRGLTQYGAYSYGVNLPDLNTYRLRRGFLLLHPGFREFCQCWKPDDHEADDHQVKELEGEVLAAWKDIGAWLREHETDHFLVCALLYGELHKRTFGQSWTRYGNSYNNYQITRRAFPCYELRPGQEAPEGRLNFSVDPRLSRLEAVRMFEKFITARRKATIHMDTPDPLRGYFFVTEKRYDPAVVRRYLDVAVLREAHPKTWVGRAAKQFSNTYPQDPDSRRRTILRDLENARRISEWAVRGRFPCTKKLDR